jgi:hypothetical protein
MTKMQDVTDSSVVCWLIRVMELRILDVYVSHASVFFNSRNIASLPNHACATSQRVREHSEQSLGYKLPKQS